MVHETNYFTALAMDHDFGILDGFCDLSPDFLNRNPWMFKSKKHSDPDTPTMREALTGPHREAFLDAMATEIDELEEHGTWDVINRTDIKPIELPDGTVEIPQVIPSTWVYRIKRNPDGEFKKTKARFCVRGDLQEKQDLKNVKTVNGEVQQTKA
jgi:hypothetical protein